MDFPEPVPPIIPSVSPFFNEKLIFFSAGPPASGYVNVRSPHSTAGAPKSNFTFVPPVTDGWVSNTSFILEDEEAAFVNITIRLAKNYKSKKYLRHVIYKRCNLSLR